MVDVKEQVAAAIIKARENLEHALSNLERVPAFEPSAVAFAAHALNNYLTITEGTIELLRTTLAAHPNPQIHTWLEGLQHATSLMTHSVSRLMSTTVPREAALQFEQVELPVLVRRVCDYYQRVADRKQLHILYSSSGEVPQVWTDRVAVAAVLDNLLSNAVKYSPEARRIWVQLHADESGVTCSVQDEGPGLSQEEQLQLFQPGVRLSPRPTGGEPSTGYGLAVAKELINQLGGAIWYVSTPGQGACFSFRLPVSRQSTAAPRGGMPESDGGADMLGR